MMTEHIRLRLTFWFVLVVMLVSGLLSTWLFRAVETELRLDYLRAERRIENRQQQQTSGPSMPRAMLNQMLPGFDQDLEQLEVFQDELALFRQDFLRRLIWFNLIVLVASALSGYWLSGRAIQPLVSALERERQFSSHVSHELRTPISALQTTLEVALADKKINVKQKKVLKESLEEVEHLEKLVNQLLQLAKNGELSKLDTAASSSIQDLLRRAKKQFGVAAKKSGHQLKWRIPKLGGKVGGGLSVWLEVMGALIENALKFAPAKTSIEVLVSQSKQHLQILVIDQGPGIPKAEQEQIFQYLYKSDFARTRGNNSGLGLGLSLARKLAQSLGGDVRLKRSSKSGSEFMLLLPLVEG